VLISLYYTLVYPHLSYCNILWGNAHNVHINRLFMLQKKVLRLITKSDYLSHTTPIFRGLKILTVFDIYKLQLGIFVFKCFHELLPTTFMSFFNLNNQFHSHNTRNSDAIHFDYPRLALNTKSVRFTGALFWNSLEPRLRSVPTLSRFKQQLKLLLLSKELDG